jgi:hypothetical protein
MLSQHFRSGLRRALTSLVACLGDITSKAINPEKTRSSPQTNIIFHPPDVRRFRWSEISL